MPLIRPKKSESKDDFVSRFISSKSAKKEYPDEEQRLAVAFSKWKESYKQNSNVFTSLSNNMSQLVKYDTLDGKDYLVAPVILIKEGVLNGSAGPIMYEGDDIELSTESWNHKPLVVYHPTINNKPLSAASKTIIEKQQIGILLDATYVNGKLKANAWIDVEKANKVDTRIIDMLENNQMLEVSTGLFTDNIIYNGEWNGKAYDSIAKNYRPDHLALLPDQIGACSIEDGAGLPRLNKENDNNKQGDVSMERKEQVDKLISNAANTWASEDSEFLIDMEQDKFDKIFSMIQEEPVVNTEEEPKEDPKVEDSPKEEKPVENQEEPKEEPKEKPVENAEETPKEEPVANKEVTLESYVADAPEAFADVLKTAVMLFNAKKDGLVSKIKANAKCGFTEEQLKAKDMQELEIIGNMLPEQKTNYGGQAGPVANKEKPGMEPIKNYLG